MTVYAEYLFAENFMAGFVILKLTSSLCGRKPGKLRTAAGCLMCAAFSFIIVFSLPSAIIILSEIVFVAAVIATVFAPAPFPVLAKLGLIFYCVSFLLGGSALAFMFITDSPGVTGNGFFYIATPAYPTVLAGGAAATAMAASVLRFVKRRSVCLTQTKKIMIELMGKKLECLGKVDSANFLKDPISGKPVSLISAKKARECWGDVLREESMRGRIRAVPYKSVGRRQGVLLTVRCDSITIDGESIFRRKVIRRDNVLMGIYEGAFTAGGEDEKFEVLLQPDLMY